ncbi:hypothetical protein B0H14DRAFT_3862044 [Mycena olivaceomarginata]|nr:hypothetical protein B0H14DRAFT_3862044 [Mycena olivaceomarginata]
MPSESPTLLEPRLPPELECRIFEIVALARPVSIPSLMLVARRVKEWPEPLLYRIIMLPGRSSPEPHNRMLDLPTFAETPFSRGQSTAESWLDACRRVTNLFFPVDSTSSPILRALDFLNSVQYLVIDPLFLHVTHLERLDLHGIGVAESDSMCGHLALIPHLTHVAFNPKLHESVSHAGLSADLLESDVFGLAKWLAPAPSGLFRAGAWIWLASPSLS